MKNINEDYSISKIPTQVAVASRLDSIVTTLIQGVKFSITRIKQRSEQAKQQTYYQRRMQKQLQQDTTYQLPLEMKLRMGFHRS